MKKMKVNVVSESFCIYLLFICFNLRLSELMEFFIFFVQIPESPIWLIAKGKHEKAEKAICWLRGWVDSETVKPELSNLLHYNNVSGTIETRDSNVVTNDSNNLLSKLAQFKEPSVYRPMKLIMIYFFTSYIVNLTLGKPFIGKIMTEVGLRDYQSICLV